MWTQQKYKMIINSTGTYFMLVIYKAKNVGFINMLPESDIQKTTTSEMKANLTPRKTSGNCS